MAWSRSRSVTSESTLRVTWKLRLFQVDTGTSQQQRVIDVRMGEFSMKMQTLCYGLINICWSKNIQWDFQLNKVTWKLFHTGMRSPRQSSLLTLLSFICYVSEFKERLPGVPSYLLLTFQYKLRTKYRYRDEGLPWILTSINKSLCRFVWKGFTSFLNPIFVQKLSNTHSERGTGRVDVPLSASTRTKQKRKHS